jgi:hypothetical protein
VSTLFAAAAAAWHECRAAFEDYLIAEINRAEAACGGVLLNERGRLAGIDPESLFRGREDRAERWASEELLAYWREHGRMTFKQWEASWPPPERLTS